ncbi:MAG: hypothetical protein ACOC8B_03075 [Gemmatimonadota bacterium]
MLGGQGFSASYTRYADAARLIGLSTTVGSRRSALGIGIGATTLHYQSSSTLGLGDVVDVSDLFDEHATGSSSLAGMIAYARPRGRVRVGAGAKLLQRHLSAIRATGFAVDVGAPFVGDWITFGAAVQNVDPDLEFEVERTPISLRTQVGLNVALGSLAGGPLHIVVPAAVTIDEAGDATPGGGVELETLRRVVREKNDRTLDELAEAYAEKTGVRPSRSNLWRTLRRAGITRKRKTLGADEHDRPDVRAEREASVAARLALDPRRLVFVDENGATTKMVRTHARSQKGERAHGTAPGGTYDKLTFFGALTPSGMEQP